MTAIIFLIVLAILIFVHELGHFLVAKACGIRVDAFALGFGPKIIGFKSGETEYRINVLPLGGYVKIFGENPDEDSMTGPESHRSFANMHRLKQVAVLAAGVIFNFIFAWIIYTIAFTGGVTATLDGFESYRDHFRNERIMITTVSPGSPAEKAGLKAGDIILAESVEKIQAEIAGHSKSPLNLKYSRNGTPTEVNIQPISGLVPDKYAIGIAMQTVADLKLPFFTAIYEALHYTIIMTRDTAVGLYGFVINIFKGTANFAEVAGPVGIAGIVGGAAELGFVYLLMITALISINLGVINLIPFPALDGGRILFTIIESITRRRIPARFANTVNTVGFGLLMFLMVIVTYKDIIKLMK